MHSLPSTELSSYVYCCRRICFRRWKTFVVDGVQCYGDDEIPWSIRHYALWRSL